MICKPWESHRVATDWNIGINGAGSSVVGFGGCDSTSIVGLVNRSLVAYRDCNTDPGLRSACKASQRSPGANRCRQLRGSENDTSADYEANRWRDHFEMIRDANGE
jgi:hypothetical protein